jgi:hypothetical protein
MYKPIVEVAWSTSRLVGRGLIGSYCIAVNVITAIDLTILTGFNTLFRGPAAMVKRNCQENQYIHLFSSQFQVPEWLWWCITLMCN